MLIKNKSAFSLTELLLVVVVVGLLTGIAVPNFLNMRQRINKDACVNNLRQIKLAKEQWALENNKDYTDTPVAADLDTYIKDGCEALVCPNDPGKSFTTSYNIDNVGTDSSCRISSTTHKL